MDSHLDCLRNICRLCGCKNPPSWKDRAPIKKESMRKLINDALEIDVGADVEGVHAYFVCKCCSLKLNRWKTKTRKLAANEKKKIKTNIVVSDDVCKSCGKRMDSPSSSTVDKPMLVLAEYETALKNAGLLTWSAGDQVHVIRLSETGSTIMRLTVYNNFDYKLSVAGTEHSTLKDFDVQNALDVKQLFSRNVCIGNNDFQDIVEKKTGPNGEIPIRITVNDSYSSEFKTIRHNKCHLFVDSAGERCCVCKIMRSNLTQIRKTQEKAPAVISASSTIPNKYLTYSQLTTKSSEQQIDRIKLKRKIECLQDVVSRIYNQESTTLSHQQGISIEKTFLEMESEFQNLLPPGSAGRLLYEQQLESLKKHKRMRWHPTVIRWCIALHSRSASNYDFLRSSGFLRLPHPSTLHKYTHFADPEAGISAEILRRIVADSGLEKDKLNQEVCLLFDEMKIKAGLYYSERTGKIVGFTDVGDISNEIARFEQRCRGIEEPTIASHVLVVMIRGIFSNLHSPIGYYATTTATSDQLFAILWEAVELVEMAGFKVRALVSDGASANRKFYRMHSNAPGKESVIYSSPHHVDSTRTLYFICDVPHLMKTTRNNFENSGYHNKTRHLHYNHQDIKWTQLLELYEWDIGLDRTSPGLRRLHRLTYDHLHLTPSLRMRVYMAAQILSSSVANALEVYGEETTKSTVKFIRMFDQFFDCLNVSNCYKGIHSRKEALKEYRSSDDWRFTWLKEDFLGFFDEWKAQVDSMENVTSSAKKKMQLSQETLEGLRITVNSFVELGKQLLDLPNVKFLLSEKFNQDPLENYFSKQRGVGGRSENPTVAQFGQNMCALYVASNCAKASRKGNSRVVDTEIVLDETPLPKRQRVVNN